MRDIAFHVGHPSFCRPFGESILCSNLFISVGELVLPVMSLQQQQQGVMGVRFCARLTLSDAVSIRLLRCVVARLFVPLCWLSSEAFSFDLSSRRS